MPFIPPSLFSPDSYLVQDPVQSAFNVSLPSIDIPDLPSLPSSESAMNFFRALWQAIVAFFVEVPANADQFAKDHPEGLKIGGIVLVVAVAIGLILLALPVLLYMLGAVGTGLASVGKVVMMPVTLAFNAIKFLFVLVAVGILKLVGFTANGVAAGSAAAGIQSIIYGPLTNGLFSVLQSLGMTIGRLAGAVVAVV